MVSFGNSPRERLEVRYISLGMEWKCTDVKIFHSNRGKSCLHVAGASSCWDRFRPLGSNEGKLKCYSTKIPYFVPYSFYKLNEFDTAVGPVFITPFMFMNAKAHQAA